MIKKVIFITGLVCMVFTLPGIASAGSCSSWEKIKYACEGTSPLAMDFGTSYKLTKINQILNPEAEKNLDPVTGLDGKASEAIIEKYHKDFVEPVKAPTSIMIGISGK